MRKSRVEILRGKLRRMGECDEIHPAMTEEVAESFIAELQLDPDVGAIAARDWRPDHRNEQPWIKGFLDAQPRGPRPTGPSARPAFGIPETDDECVN